MYNFKLLFLLITACKSDVFEDASYYWYTSDDGQLLEDFNRFSEESDNVTLPKSVSQNINLRSTYTVRDKDFLNGVHNLIDMISRFSNIETCDGKDCFFNDLGNEMSFEIIPVEADEFMKKVNEVGTVFRTASSDRIDEL